MAHALRRVRRARRGAVRRLPARPALSGLVACLPGVRAAEGVETVDGVACLALLCLAIGLCYPWITVHLIQPGVTVLMGAKVPLM